MTSDKPYPTVLDLETRVAALEKWAAQFPPMGVITGPMTWKAPEGCKMPQPVADDAACLVALTQLIVDATLPEKCDPAQIAFTYACGQKVATSILAAIRAGKVPGVCCDNDANSLARRLAADLASLNHIDAALGKGGGK